MINTVTITNHLNESIVIDMRFPEKSGFLIYDIKGLDPPKATINNTEVAAIDGSFLNSARVGSRNIVFLIKFVAKPTIAIVRRNSYKYFPIKKRIKMLFEMDDRSFEVYGNVESNEINIFGKEQGSTISVICQDSYLFDTEMQVTLFSSIESLFEFPFSNESTTQNLIEFGNLEIYTTKSVYYEGDASVGLIIYIHAIGEATNIEITNVRTSESISIDSAKLVTLTGTGIHLGDDIVISTVKGDKYIKLIRDGSTVNIRNVLGENPDWFQLEKGDNIFVYTADTGVSNLQFRIENKVAYEGA